MLFAGLLATPSSAAEAEDWARIAAETDEPGFAIRVTRVLPRSEAERLGLLPGDYVYQLGDAGAAAIASRRDGQPDAIFFCRAGGRKERDFVGAGIVGFSGALELRPQLEYLRGTVGTPDPRWDEAAAAALALLAGDPEAAEEGWDGARKLGYPDDELDAFVRAYCDLELRRPVRVREAFEAVDREFLTMPCLYFALLEDMAYASGQTDLLRRLRELDPGSSLVDEAALAIWEELLSGPLPRRRLLELARERRGRSLLGELEVPAWEEDGRFEGRLRHFLNKGAFRLPAGSAATVKFTLPEDVRDFHYSVAFALQVIGFREGAGCRVRVAARTREGQGRGEGAHPLAEVEVATNPTRSTLASFRGGYGSLRRHASPRDSRIPMKDEGGEGDEGEGEEALSRPFRVDLVRVGNEIAAYLDGVERVRLPVDPEDLAEELFFYTNGITAKITDVQVWKLDE